MVGLGRIAGRRADTAIRLTGQFIWCKGFVVDLGNGGPGAILGSAPDAFSYGLVEVFEDAGQPRLRFTARGNPDYLAGANDPTTW